MNLDDELASLKPTAAPENLSLVRLARAARARRAVIWAISIATAALLATAAAIWLPDALRWGYYEPKVIPAAVVQERCGGVDREDVPAGWSTHSDDGSCNVGYDQPAPQPPFTVDMADPRGTCERASGYTGLGGMRLLASQEAEWKADRAIQAYFLSRNGYLGMCIVAPTAGALAFVSLNDLNSIPPLTSPSNDADVVTQLHRIPLPIVVDGRLLTDAAIVRVTLDETGETDERPLTNGIALGSDPWQLKQPVTKPVSITTAALARDGSLLAQYHQELG